MVRFHMGIAEVTIRKVPVSTHLAQCCPVFNSNVTQIPTKLFLSFSCSSETIFSKATTPYKSCMLTYRKQSATRYRCAPGSPRTQHPSSHSNPDSSIPPHVPSSLFVGHKYLKSSTTWQWENNAINSLCVASFHAQRSITSG